MFLTLDRLVERLQLQGVHSDLSEQNQRILTLLMELQERRKDLNKNRMMVEFLAEALERKGKVTKSKWIELAETHVSTQALIHTGEPSIDYEENTNV